MSKKYDMVKYISIDFNGKVYSGNELTIKAKSYTSSYMNSCSLIHKGFVFPDEKMMEIKKELEMISEDGKHLLVMSCEGFVHWIDQISETAFFEKLNTKIYPVCYLRNPVEWVNSAWWQWGAWGSDDIDNFITSGAGALAFQWYDLLLKWQEYVGKENFITKILPKDINEDFFNHLNIKFENTSSNNKSLTAEMLTFFQKHRILRPGPEECEMDFIISSSFNNLDKYNKTPWVLDKKYIEYILGNTENLQQNLPNLLDIKSKKLYDDDPKWYSIDAFSSKKLVPTFNKEILSEEKMDQLLLDALLSIKELHKDNLRLNHIVNKKESLSVENIFDFAIKFQNKDKNISIQLLEYALQIRPKGLKIRKKLQELKDK